MTRTTPTIGTTLATWRQHHGLSVEKAAALFGVARSTIYRWEDGSMAMDRQAQRLLRLYQDETIYTRAQRLLARETAP